MPRLYVPNLSRVPWRKRLRAERPPQGVGVLLKRDATALSLWPLRVLGLGFPARSTQASATPQIPAILGKVIKRFVLMTNATLQRRALR
ncbi:MAG: hypothetical protein MI924_24875 [Chloroflexales bacterium]|nr:hypothetical protein [Chloroflexales bacterium]